jgi:hypothetical protein
VDFYLEHYREHFTNIGNFRQINFGNSFGSMETILKASKHIMSVSKLHSIHVELQKFKGTTPIHAPHTCSSKHFVISMSLSIIKARQTLLYCKRNSFAKKHTLVLCLSIIFCMRLLLLLAKKHMNLKIQYIDPIICHINDFNLLIYTFFD